MLKVSLRIFIVSHSRPILEFLWQKRRPTLYSNISSSCSRKRAVCVKCFSWQKTYNYLQDIFHIIRLAVPRCLKAETECAIVHRTTTAVQERRSISISEQTHDKHHSKYCCLKTLEYTLMRRFQDLNSNGGCYLIISNHCNPRPKPKTSGKDFKLILF